MFTFCSFLQSLCRFIGKRVAKAVSMTKRMYRSCAVIVTGTMVVAVMTFSSAGFSGGGHNALTAYAETSSEHPEEAEVPEDEAQTASAADAQKRTEEVVLLTEGKLQLRLTDSESLQSGQMLVGDTLARDVQEDTAVRQERKNAVNEAKEEIRQIEEERARIAAEEAARRAEEERIRQEAEARKASAVVSYSNEDYEVLKKIVEAEAGICDIRGRILVANVIINRVKDSEFPNNITDVVYERSQFSPVIDGRINTCKVTEETVEAVNRALSGEDYSDGALFFMNRKRSHSSNVRWFDGKLTYLFEHDRHEFYR